MLSIDYDTLDLIEHPIVIVLSMLRSMMIREAGARSDGRRLLGD
jgi:hypothetical protein